MRDLAFIVLFVAMLPAVFKRAATGVMLWIWVALVSPNAYVYSFARDISFNKFAAISTLIALLFDKTKRRPYFDTHVILLILFFIQLSISYFFAISAEARNDEIYERVGKIFILAVVLVSLISTRLGIHGIILAICLGLGIHGTLDGLRYIATAGGHKISPPANFGDNNSFAVTLMMLAPLLWYLSVYSKEKIVRITTRLAVGINVAAVVGSGSRGAAAGLATIALALILQSKNKIPMLLAVLVIGAAGLSLTTDEWRTRMGTINTAEQDSSFMARVAAWKMNTVIAVDRPLTGGGFGVSTDPRVHDAYRSRFNSFSFFIDTGTLGGPLEAHSIYFQALGDTGFIGLALFLGLLATAYANIRAINRMAKGRPELTWASDLATWMRLGLIAYSVSGALLSLVYLETYYVYITLLSVLRDFVQRQAKTVVETVQPTISRSRMLAEQAAARVT